jgi:membrane-associated phospholipid phosphatase
MKRALLAAIAIAIAHAQASAQAPPGVHTSAPAVETPPPDVEAVPEGDARGGDTEPDPDARPEAGEDIMRAVGENLDIDALAQDTHSRVHWHPEWPRYRFDELILTFGMGIVIGLAELLPTRSERNWVGETPLDTATQEALGLDNPEDRTLLDQTSDGLLAALVLWPLAVDSLLYAGLGENAWDAAWQMSLISLEVFAINHALNITIKLLSRRERPHGLYCRTRENYDDDPLCGDPLPAESFWSGHVSNAFAGAALVCLHHDVFDLFGDVAADGAACGSALAMAAATGIFRIMADRHWVTDVLTGAVVGSAIGILVPYLLHYQGGARAPLRGAPPTPIVFAPMFGDEVIGLTGYGVW